MSCKGYLLALGLAFTLLSGPPALSQPDQTVRLAQQAPDDAMVIGPLRMGTLDSEVKAAIGEPEEKTGPEPDETNGKPIYYWDYPSKGANLVFEAEKEGAPLHLVTVILFEPSDWKAASGLSIGMGEAAARAALKSWLGDQGVKELDLGEQGADTAAIHFLEEDIVLAVAFEAGKVSSIFLGPP